MLEIFSTVKQRIKDYYQIINCKYRDFKLRNTKFIDLSGSLSDVHSSKACQLYTNEISPSNYASIHRAGFPSSSNPVPWLNDTRYLTQYPFSNRQVERSHPNTYIGLSSHPYTDQRDISLLHRQAGAYNYGRVCIHRMPRIETHVVGDPTGSSIVSRPSATYGQLYVHAEDNIYNYALTSIYFRTGFTLGSSWLQNKTVAVSFNSINISANGYGYGVVRVGIFGVDWSDLSNSWGIEKLSYTSNTSGTKTFSITATDINSIWLNVPNMDEIWIIIDCLAIGSNYDQYDHPADYASATAKVYWIEVRSSVSWPYDVLYHNVLPYGYPRMSATLPRILYSAGSGNSGIWV